MPEEKKEVRTLSTIVIKRILGEEKYQEFLENYRSARKRGYVINRFELFEAEITPDEMRQLEDMLDKRIRRGQLKDKYYPNTAYESWSRRIGRLALRVLYQNPELLARFKAKGGEKE